MMNWGGLLGRLSGGFNKMSPGVLLFSQTKSILACAECVDPWERFNNATKQKEESQIARQL